MKLGVNLEGVSRAQSDCKLSNLLYPVGGWVTIPDNVPLRPGQWTPPGDPAANGATPGVPAWTHAATVGYAPAGTYTIRAEGAGRVEYNGTFDFTGVPDQSFTTTLPGTGETSLFVRATDPSNPLKKLRLIGPSATTPRSGPRNTWRASGDSVLRAMDWDIGVQNSYNPYDPPDWIAVRPDLGGGGIQYWSQADLRPGRGPRGTCELVTALAKVHGDAAGALDQPPLSVRLARPRPPPPRHRLPPGEGRLHAPPPPGRDGSVV
jgi:hypothetical protein